MGEHLRDDWLRYPHLAGRRRQVNCEEWGGGGHTGPPPLVYALLILYHQGGPFSLKQALRELRFQMHERLYQLGYEQGQRDALAQVALAGAATAEGSS